MTPADLDRLGDATYPLLRAVERAARAVEEAPAEEKAAVCAAEETAAVRPCLRDLLLAALPLYPLDEIKALLAEGAIRREGALAEAERARHVHRTTAGRRVRRRAEKGARP